MPQWKMRSIGAILKRSRSTVLRAAAVWEHWDDVVGPQIAARAQPLSFRDGVLWVAVQNAAWLQELQFQTETIIEGLDRALGERLICEIRFRQGRVRSKAPKTAPPRPGADSEHALDPEMERSIRRSVERVSDPELRRLIENLWMRTMARRG